MGKTKSENFKCVGFKVEQDPESFAITLDQLDYAQKIEMIKISPERALTKGEKTSNEETSEMRRTAGRLGEAPDLICSSDRLRSAPSLSVVLWGILCLPAQPSEKSSLKVGSYLLKRDLGDVTNWSIQISTDASFKNLNDAAHVHKKKNTKKGPSNGGGGGGPDDFFYPKSYFFVTLNSKKN